MGNQSAATPLKVEELPAVHSPPPILPPPKIIQKHPRLSAAMPWEETSLGSIPQDLRSVILSYIPEGTTYFSTSYLLLVLVPPVYDHYSSPTPITFSDQASHDNSLKSSILAVIVDPAGLYFIADGTHRLHVCQLSGDVEKPTLTKIHTYATHSTSKFNTISALELDLSGHIIIVDQKCKRIQTFDQTTGETISEFTLPGSQHVSPISGLAVDKEGNFVISDLHHHKIQVYSPSGALLRSFGDQQGKAPGFLDSPCGIGIDPKTGNIITAETRNHRLQVFSPEGEFVRMIGWRDPTGDVDCQLSYPDGVAVGQGGKILCADTGKERFVIYSPEGKMLQALSFKGTGLFKGPVFDRTGDILGIGTYGAHVFPHLET